MFVTAFYGDLNRILHWIWHLVCIKEMFFINMYNTKEFPTKVQFCRENFEMVDNPSLLTKVLKSLTVHERFIESLNASIMHLFLIPNQVRIQHLWITHMLCVLYLVHMNSFESFPYHIQKMPIMCVKIHWQGKSCCCSS